jgi:hypothetical protein
VAEWDVPERERCRYCGSPLTNVQATTGGICRDARCQNRGLAETWGELRAEEARRLSIADPESYAIIIVDPQHLEPVPLPAGRRERFRAHLTETVARAMETEADPDGPGEIPAAPEGLRAWLGAICAACRGPCCRAGRETAFLDVPAIHEQMKARPGRGAGEIVDDYVGRLPGESFDGACVFQGCDGCALPRERRARICNIYECSGLRMARRLHRLYGTERAFLLAVEDGEAGECAFVTLPGR